MDTLSTPERSRANKVVTVLASITALLTAGVLTGAVMDSLNDGWPDNPELLGRGFIEGVPAQALIDLQCQERDTLGAVVMGKVFLATMSEDGAWAGRIVDTRTATEFDTCAEAVPALQTNPENIVDQVVLSQGSLETDGQAIHEQFEKLANSNIHFATING